MSDGSDVNGDSDGNGGREGRDDARTVRVGVVDAFAADPLAGAPVGVVPDAGGLGAETVRALARELGAGGTAFVGPSDGADADGRLRYVPAGDRRWRDRTGGNGRTDEGETGNGRTDEGQTGNEGTDGDRNGDAVVPPVRATVAACARLLADGRVEPGPLALGTAAGVVDVEATADGVVWVAADAPSVETVDLDYDRAGEALGVDPAALRDVGADLPAAVASVGRPFLVVPVNFLEHLSGADPDGDALAALTDAHGVAGVYPVTFDALDADATLHARCFEPGPDRRGAVEDPVTGVAAGAAGAYLGAVDAFDGDPPDGLRVEQGHFVDRPGVVRVRMADDGVLIGGRAVAALDGRVTLPGDDAAGDDIVVA